MAKMQLIDAEEISRTPWSVSLHKSMRTCQRRFAFQHLVASGVAKDAFRHRAYIAKQAQDLTAWQGHVIHDVLAHEFLEAIRGRRRPKADELTAAADQLIREQLSFSTSRRFNEDGMTKAAAGRQYCVLREHLSGREIPSEEIDHVHKAARDCFEFILGRPDLIDLLLRSHDHESELTLRFDLAGWPVRGTIDLLFKDGRNGLWIVDWKIAKSLTSDYSHQLGLYALAVSASPRYRHADPAQIRAIEVNPVQRKIRNHPITADTLRSAEDFAFRGIVELRNLLSIATDPIEILADLDTANTLATCQYCAFSGLCIEALIRAGQELEAEAIQGTLWPC